MIDTLFSLNGLGTPQAFFLAILIGCGFGFALERAGFGSSRRLAGVFYFTDMAVVKVMFSAVITAMLGLSFLVALGWIQLEQIYLMPTIYMAQIVGGLLFGIGFVMAAWCPGTAAAGIASGRIDALVFIVGVTGGSILFNEIFPAIRTLYTTGNQGVEMAYETVGMSRNWFILLLTLVAVVTFWLSEWAEKKRTGIATYWGSPFLKAFSLALVSLALSLFVLSPSTNGPAESAKTTAVTAVDENALMANVEQALDHIEPEELADRLMAGEQSLLVVDVRPVVEFNAFHIRSAINVPIAQLPETLQPYRDRDLIVLYSNGMTHPAQARDSLQRQGFGNVYILTDGVQGFRDRCLKPVSLRSEPLTASDAVRVNAWRAFFAAPAVTAEFGAAAEASPRVIETEWLNAHLGTPSLKIIDLRPQPEYNTAHIPGSLSLNVESLRGNIAGVPSLLLPPYMLAEQFSLLGLRPSDTIVLVSADKLYDPTLASMAFARLGHVDHGVMNGGFAKWALEKRPVDTALPVTAASIYPVNGATDDFTVGLRAVAAALGKTGTVIIDVRPAEYFSGKKSDEARAGHLPGAINRPFSEDIITTPDKVVTFKSISDLAAAYKLIIPSMNSEIIVHCRTGHQASQTFFVLKHLLGYPNVRWYDAGWTEWATHLELPVVKDAP